MKDFCKPLDSITKSKAEKYTVEFCSLLKNRSNKQYVCKSCLSEIDRNKVPRKSKINKMKFINYPASFIEELKKSCLFRESSYKFENMYGGLDYERSFFNLNRLESYLLKLVIPFVRVAHCPRGPYLKVKGDLILISSDLEHSMSRILPVNQNLIPVCFKRKLAYSGSYIEEVVEKKKVELFFKFLKMNNHLYKDLKFDSDLLDRFLEDSMSTDAAFEVTSNFEDVQITVDEAQQNDESFNIFDVHELREPAISNGDDSIQSKTTVLMNKYSEDVDEPSVANTLATMIVEYEIQNDVSFTPLEDFDIDDEIISEEEFCKILYDVNEDNDNPKSSKLKNTMDENELANIYDQLESVQVSENIEVTGMPLPSLKTNMDDNFLEKLNAIVDPTEENLRILKEEVFEEVKRTSRKMRKISVAPGEGGQFQNWGTDIYLEEKCYPNFFLSEQVVISVHVSKILKEHWDLPNTVSDN